MRPGRGAHQIICRCNAGGEEQHREGAVGRLCSMGAGVPGCWSVLVVGMVLMSLLSLWLLAQPMFMRTATVS